MYVRNLFSYRSRMREKLRWRKGCLNGRSQSIIILNENHVSHRIPLIILKICLQCEAEWIRLRWIRPFMDVVTKYVIFESNEIPRIIKSWVSRVLSWSMCVCVCVTFDILFQIQSIYMGKNIHSSCVQLFFHPWISKREKNKGKYFIWPNTHTHTT